MISRLCKFLAALLLSCASGLALATPTGIDIFNTPGLPGTGGTVTLMGPCYCNQQVVFSPLMVLPPGTYDLGTVREYWKPANYTPDGGPDQAILFLMFQPIELTGSLIYGFPAEPDYLYPTLQSCQPTDAACIAQFAGAWEDFSLKFTLTPDNDAVQIGLVVDFAYTPPALVPVLEPATAALLLAGLALLLPAAGIARPRARRAR